MSRYPRYHSALVLIGPVASASRRCRLLLLAAAVFSLFLPSALSPLPSATAQSIPLSPTAQASGAQITYSHGIEFVTIGSPDNAPWPGNGTEGDRAVGRGSVGNEYRIGRFEVTTAQWVEFFNAAYDRPATDRLPHLIPPSVWGAVSTQPQTPGGRRWTVPAGNEMRGVGNISWRMAAMYTNWLHNDRSTDRSAFMNGAYDVSTFGSNGMGFTDQFTRNPGARYWIPTLDEWIKSVHFDPNRNGPGQGGWWTQPNATDDMLAYGPPGVRVLTGFNSGPDPNGPFAQANGGWDDISFPGFHPYGIPLGAYPTVQSPWGLLDVAGGTTEWSEEVSFVNGVFPSFRLFDGSPWQSSANSRFRDRVGFTGGDFPSLSTSDLGFRVASAVPSPASSAVGLGLLFALNLRRRRDGGFHAVQPSFDVPCSRNARRI